MKKYFASILLLALPFITSEANAAQILPDLSEDFPETGKSANCDVWGNRPFCETLTLASPAMTSDSLNSKKYENSSRHFKHFWHVLTPKRIVVQYGGGIGMFSAGMGWVYGKRKSWETDLLIGFVPSYSTGGPKATITLKETYSPFDIKLKNTVFSYRPLACGLYLNTILGQEFWVNEPKRYPKKYYGFPTGLRAGIFLGQRINIHIPPKHRWWFKDIMFYYEANTCDLHIASCATNKEISVWDIINFSCGLKFTVF